MLQWPFSRASNKLKIDTTQLSTSNFELVWWEVQLPSQSQAWNFKLETVYQRLTNLHSFSTWALGLKASGCARWRGIITISTERISGYSRYTDVIATGVVAALLLWTLLSWASFSWCYGHYLAGLKGGPRSKLAPSTPTLWDAPSSARMGL